MVESHNGNEGERRTLWIVLVLNLALAGAFLASGAIGDSSALIANGLDNLSDSAVYALSLVALSRGPVWKRRAATISGTMLLVFAVSVLIDVGRRYFGGSEPIGITMMIMAAVAAAVNYLCLHLLQRRQKPDVNIRAATTFSLNDFVSNGGVLAAGLLVAWLGTNWPDLLVGLATALIAIKGGVEILRDSHQQSHIDRETES